MKKPKPQRTTLKEFIRSYGGAKLARLCGVDRSLPCKWGSGKVRITNLDHIQIILREAKGTLELADLQVKKGGAQ